MDQGFPRFSGFPRLLALLVAANAAVVSPSLAGELPAAESVKPVEVILTHDYTEGVVVDHDGNLYISHGEIVTKVTPDGKGSTWAKTGAPNGHKILAYDFTKMQYEAFGKLVRGLQKLLPNLPLDYPQSSPGVQSWDTLPQSASFSFAGYISHYHLITQKWDPGPFDFKKFLSGLRGQFSLPIFWREPKSGEDKPLDRKRDQTVAAVAEDIEALSFNKAVARIYELTSAIEKAAPSASRSQAIRTVLLLVAPMMPHLAEEAWSQIGEGLVADAAWPPVDPALLVEDEVTVAVQVKGKLRDTLTVAKGTAREELEALALASDKVQRALDGAEVKKVIVVPDRLVNLVA